jgi:hypothetical protein
VPIALTNVRCWGHTGKLVLDLSFSGFDPQETLAAQDFRSAKASFAPSLKRDIVLSIACTRPPAGGLAWQSTPDGENSYSHWAAQQLRGRSRSQQLGRVYRIGMLETIPAASNAANFDALRKGLRELSYVEGQNLIIDYRSADGRTRLILIAQTSTVHRK